MDYSVSASGEVVGRALKALVPNRDDVVIASKLYNPMSDNPNDRGRSRKHEVLEAPCRAKPVLDHA